MVTLDSTEASSWDFSRVHDLLRSPTYGGTLSPSRQCIPSDPAFQAQHQRKNFVDDNASINTKSLSSPSSHTKLGDFGSLWELLDQGRASVSLTPALITTKPKLQEDAPSPKGPSAFSILKRPVNSATLSDGAVAGPTALVSDNRSNTEDVRPSKLATDSHAPRFPPPAQPFSILKRVADDERSGKTVNVKFDPPRTPTRQTKPIFEPGSSSDTPKAKAKRRAGGKTNRANTRKEAMSSEGSAGVDSDSSFVFDRPTPKRKGAFAFVPSQIGAPEATNNRYDTPPSSYDEQEWALDPDTIRNGLRVRSTLYKSSTERRIALMARLLKDFPDYARIVSQVGQSIQHHPTNGIDSHPVHIFVDMSNIMVGFHDSVKASRSIPQSTRIRRVHMSFANLALIMERGRQTAKRVLVGSDRLPSIDEAENLGYEANILDRVQKAKHQSTPRRNNKPRKYPVYGSQSAPETVVTSGERWVEQGVDEILHLKILESLLDCDEPATIVLATGDAAVAEFSGGFMKMVERALQRGWIVELVSFVQGTSYAYRKKEFRAQWGDRFRLVELDRYAEELFE